MRQYYLWSLLHNNMFSSFYITYLSIQQININDIIQCLPMVHHYNTHILLLLLFIFYSIIFLWMCTFNDISFVILNTNVII